MFSVLSNMQQRIDTVKAKYRSVDATRSLYEHYKDLGMTLITKGAYIHVYEPSNGTVDIPPRCVDVLLAAHVR